MKIVIKKFEELTTKELYDILKLRSDVFVVEQECAYPDCDGRDIHSHHLYVEKDNEIVGYLRILEKGQTFDQLAIGRVVVREDYRGVGLAHHMMNKALLFIDEYLQETTVKLSAQQHLTEFYKSLGFYPISEGYVEDGIPHIDMEYKVITSAK